MYSPIREWPFLDGSLFTSTLPQLRLIAVDGSLRVVLEKLIEIGLHCDLVISKVLMNLMPGKRYHVL